MTRTPTRFDLVPMGALFVLMLVAVGAHFSFGVFFPPLLEQLDRSRASVSSVFTVYMVVYVVAQVIAGWLADRFGSAIVIGVTGCCFAAGFALMGVATELWHAYLAYGILVAIGFSGSYIPAIAASSQLLGHRRAAALGVATAGSGAGVALVGPAADVLLRHVGAAAAYRVLGLVLFVATASVAVALDWYRRATFVANTNQSFGRERRGQQRTVAKGPSFRQVLKRQETWWLIVAIATLNLAVGTYTVHAVALSRGLGLGAAAASAALIWVGLGRASGSLLAGRIAPMVGSVVMSKVMVAGVVLVMALLPFLAGRVVPFYLLSILFGIGFGGTTVGFPMIVGDAFGSESLGRIFGMVNIGYGLGGGIGPLVVGWLYDRSQSYSLGFGLAAVCAAIGVAALRALQRSIPERRVKEA